MISFPRALPALIGLVVALLGDGPAAPLWQPLAPGSEHLALTSDSGSMELFRFDLERFRADVVTPGFTSPPTALTAATARQELGAAAVVNGGFFDERRRSLGLRIASGKARAPLRRRVEWGVLVIRDRRAQIVHSDAYVSDPKITGAIQVGPRVLVNGKALKLKPQRARRTVVALDDGGRFLTLVLCNGQVDANTLAAQLQALGFASALMLDGGPSAQISFAVGGFQLDLPGGYPVPDLLALLPRP